MIAQMVHGVLVFPLARPLILGMIVIMWRLNAGTSDRVLEQSEDYYEAQGELHSRYEDWVAISRIASLGVDASKLADRFEDDARQAQSSPAPMRRAMWPAKTSPKFNPAG